MHGTQGLDQEQPAGDLDLRDIPDIDVSALFGGDKSGREQVVEKIRAACNKPGFFYVHNTCVSHPVIADTLSAMKQFFALPDDNPVKREVHNANAEEMKGWGPLFGEPAYQAGTTAHLESFDLGQQLTEAQYAELGITPNIWPDLQEFREAVLTYNEGVTRLGRAIAEAMSEILGEDQGFINSHSGPDAERTLRLLHYPENNAGVTKGNVGISAHTDFECFTIMNQTAPGLELTDNNGEWVRAPDDIGTFTIILGDMLERFSNGSLKATGHRVTNTPWTRYSLILFFALDNEFEVAPLPQFVNARQPSRYAPITQGAHIEAELAKAEANSAVD